MFVKVDLVIESVDSESVLIVEGVLTDSALLLRV